MATKLLRYQHELAGLMTETLAIILQIYLTVHVQLNRIHSYLQKRTFFDIYYCETMASQY